jgi:Skp family chaperone for outer membrane proteins
MIARRASTCRFPRASSLLLALALALAGTALPAQQADTAAPEAGEELATPILTVDQDRLFNQSAFGKRVAAELDERSRRLAAENRSIEADLIAEEQALTDERPKLAPEAFRQKADAFDAKVQRIRAEQDQKAKDLVGFRDAEQKRFSGKLGPILAQIARERGAVLVIDRRTTLVSADQIDITDAAIDEVDRQLGSGAEAAPEAPPGPPAPAEPADPAEPAEK